MPSPSLHLFCPRPGETLENLGTGQAGGRPGLGAGTGLGRAGIFTEQRTASRGCLGRGTGIQISDRGPHASRRRGRPHLNGIIGCPSSQIKNL